MKLIKPIPKLSLKLAGTEIYPMIVKAVTARGLTRHTGIGVGSVDMEDFIGNAVLQVLLSYRRFKGSTRITTFVFKRLNGSFIDLMRSEMNYVNRTALVELESATFANREAALHSPSEIEAQIDRQRELRWLHIGMLGLTKQERGVIIDLYLNGKSVAAISDDIWVSRRDVAALRDSALRKLRAAFPPNFSR